VRITAMSIDELAPVEEHEFVLRRIHRNAYNSNLDSPILRIAFQPNQNDDTGLSVFRERFVDATGTLADIAPEKRDAYFVARLAVLDLRSIGLTVVPEPQPQGPRGHAVIPELSWQAFGAEKHALKAKQLQLAKWASAAIILSPPA
jgi:hypothetical protein